MYKKLRAFLIRQLERRAAPVYQEISETGMDDLVFFTPSYRGDFQRFRLLRESIMAFYQGSATHYVVVPKQDFALFNSLAENDKALIVKLQNEYVDRIFYPTWWYPLAARILPNWRIKEHSGRAGWIIQQIVKLNADIIHPNSVYIMCDSDMVFIRPFGPSDLGVYGDKRILFKYFPTAESALHRDHMSRARKLLHIDEGSTEYHYIGWPVVIYSEWLKALKDRLEEIYKTNWQLVLANAEWFSEYCIYGVFVEEIVKPKNLEISSDEKYHLIWDQQSYEAIFLNGEVQLDGNQKIALTIQSNLSIETSSYNNALVAYIRTHSRKKKRN